jgi:protein gp37
MTQISKIEWTEATWNPTIGCTKVSPGCKNCYAEKMANRLQAMGMPCYKDGFVLQLMPNRLLQPLLRNKPTVHFVNSMSDLFHEKVPNDFIEKVFSVIERCPQHTFQVLTKRAVHLLEYFQSHPVPANAWIGVSVEDQKFGLPRIGHLQAIKAATRFLSIEPLLEDLRELDLSGIHWVIVGGESGHKARPMEREWEMNIHRQCVAQDVPFFFKQWGTWGDDGVRRNKKANGRLFEGCTWDEMPHQAAVGSDNAAGNSLAGL